MRLNVADCQLRQNGVSPMNSISSVAPSRDSVDIHPTAGKAANSDKKTYTLEDLVEQVNIQHSLLMDEKNVPQEWLPVPENHMMSSDQSSDNGSSSMALLSVHEDEPEVLAEQKKSSVDYEKHSEHEIEERRSLDYDEGRENEVTSSGRRETIDHEEEETSHLQVEFGKHGVHTESRESDAISTRTSKKWNGRHSKGKTENENDKRENLVAEVDKGVRRGDTEVVRDNDSVTVLSKYSFDVSVCETREHSVESSVGSSTSSSYEGVKIVVSVSELTEKKYKSGSSPEKTEVICCKSSAQKDKRYDALGQKICRQKHRRTGRGSRDVKEKATMTTESELKEPSKREPGVVAGKGETERIKDKDRTEMWHHVTNRTVISDKDMSEDSTSYMSPPDHLAPSHIQYLGKLLAAVHEFQKKGDPDIHEINPQLALYISRLLAMSRESVERLGVSTSDVSTPDVETSTAGGIYAKSPCAAAEHSTREQTKGKENTRKQMHANVKAEDAIKEMTKAVTVSHSEHESVTCTRQAVSHCGTQTQSTSVPLRITNGELPDEHVLRKSSFLLHSSCTCDENSGDFDIKTPSVPSVIADMSHDEYKTVKFPEMFSDYSDKCSERITKLTRAIEQIRGVKRKLMEGSGTGTSASSSCSSNEDQRLDSTKYLSPPESSVVMTHLSSKDNKRITPSQKMGLSDEEMAVPISACDVDSTAAQCSSSKPSGGSKASMEQQQKQKPSQGKRPPPCLWSQKLQRLVLLTLVTTHYNS